MTCSSSALIADWLEGELGMQLASRGHFNFEITSITPKNPILAIYSNGNH